MPRRSAGWRAAPTWRGPAVPEPTQARLKLVLEDRVPSPVVVVGFSGPVAQSPDNGALSIAAELLGNGEIRLPAQPAGLRRRASPPMPAPSWTAGLLGGRFTFEAGAAEGVDAGSARKPS